MTPAKVISSSNTSLQGKQFSDFSTPATPFFPPLHYEDIYQPLGI